MKPGTAPSNNWSSTDIKALSASKMEISNQSEHVLSKVSANRFNPFSTLNRAKFIGGMQLSLDLAKAFDKMPRHLLLMALERIALPEVLISLILYIHDNATMKFQKVESHSSGFGGAVL